MIKLLIPNLLLYLTLLAPGFVYADPNSEREALARLTHELTALEPLRLRGQISY